MFISARNSEGKKVRYLLADKVTVYRFFLAWQIWEVFCVGTLPWVLSWQVG